MDDPGFGNTFTIIGRCARTGLLGVAMASSSIALASRCPWVRGNVAALAVQAYADPGLGPFALDLAARGYAPARIIEEMRANDAAREFRQIGIVDQHGRSTVVTGAECPEYAGAIAETDMVAMGNYLVGPAVVADMARAFRASAGEILEERLMRALEAARDAGGEKGGQYAGAIMVAGRHPYPRTDLRTDAYDPVPGGPACAVGELRRILDRYAPLIDFYEQRAWNPRLGEWQDWAARKQRQT